MSAQAELSQSNHGIERLKLRSDFVRLRSGRKFSTAHFVVQSLEGENSKHAKTCRVGFTVTSRIGNAVERNRIKRRLKSAAGEVFGRLGKAGRDYVIIARRKCLNGSYEAIVTDLQQALDHLHANRAKGSKHRTKFPT